MNWEKSLEVIFFQKILKTRNKYVTKKIGNKDTEIIATQKELYF